MLRKKMLRFQNSLQIRNQRARFNMKHLKNQTSIFLAKKKQKPLEVIKN